MDENIKIHNLSVKKIFQILIPPPKWKFTVIILMGIATGLFFNILVISKAPSYLSDEPEVCINCHVMIPQYSTWERGSHGRVAKCNDCHVPHNNIFNKYFFKAKDGTRHSYMFTFRLEPQVIQIKDAGKEVVQGNCIRCHDNIIHPLSMRQIDNKSIMESGEGYCWKCHKETPHGKVNSLSASPFSLIPNSGSVVPEWLDKKITK
jgi:cytochrome c nitrite reductase small subunit